MTLIPMVSNTAAWAGLTRSRLDRSSEEANVTCSPASAEANEDADACRKNFMARTYLAQSNRGGITKLEIELKSNCDEIFGARGSTMVDESPIVTACVMALLNTSTIPLATLTDPGLNSVTLEVTK